MAPAHGEFVRSVIDQRAVYQRLQEFPAIARNFPPAILRSCATRAPYYCHFMEWRLARLPDSYLKRFDQLLHTAEEIDNWDRESRSLVHSCDFSEFWSLTWQLQVAEYLRGCGYDLAWMPDGPDLKATRSRETRYVECTTPRKHFGRSLYLEEVLRALHPKLQVRHQMFLKRSMPDGADLDAFLDELFGRLLVPGALDGLVAQAATSYPVVVTLPAGAENLHVYLDGDDRGAYDPSVLPHGHGDIDDYWALILREVVSNKDKANALATHRPNAVAVNFLLGDDQQVATSFGEAPPPPLGDNIDELIWATAGIRSAVAEEDWNSVNGWVPRPRSV